VQPKARYALTYLPGLGTQLAINAEPLGTIEGLEFARAVFAIWIGKNPIDKTFRDRLLGKSK
ncbi:MAG: chalcone isomerase family protein, partial [Desulfobacter sp.]|nr:chalcone isomerase family protein [Desulfobacter sp.]